MRARQGTTATWQSTVRYRAGGHVLRNGVLYRARREAARSNRPAGVGDGSTPDRDLLLAERTGFALTADTTGGYAGDTYLVTTTANTGAGSLRAGLEDAAAKWIVFSPSLDGQTISLTTSVFVRANKTIDGRAVPNLTIIPRQGIFHWGIISPNNGASSVRYTSGIANIIWAYVTLDGAMSVNNRGVISAAYGCDKQWIHHVTVAGGTDTILTFADTASSGSGNPGHYSEVPCRVTISWSKIGPQPRLSELASWPVTGEDNRAENGKLLHFGLDPEDSDTPDLLQVTVDHSWLYGGTMRQPMMQWCRVHWLNCHVEKWGMPPGLAYGPVEAALYRAAGFSVIDGFEVAGEHNATGALASQIKPGGEFLAEGSIWTPYVFGEGHAINSAWPVLTPDPLAVKDSTAQYIKVTGAWLRNGATKAADKTPGSIFVPPYSYTAAAADSDLLADLDASAGNVQSWVAA